MSNKVVVTKKRKMHELVSFLAVWADQYARERGLNGLHPTHWVLMKKYGCPMDRFQVATNVAQSEITHDALAVGTDQGEAHGGGCR